MGTLLKDRMALLKGHLSLEEATNWPESPEQATEKYCSFFGKWFALGAPSKPEIRLACSEAWPKLSSQSLKGLVNGLQECRAHLRRKQNLQGAARPDAKHIWPSRKQQPENCWF